METEKIKVLNKIINLIPKCSAFIEAMTENGSIFDKIERPKTTIVNHADQSPEAKQKYNKYHNIIAENVPYHKLLALYSSLLKKKTPSFSLTPHSY